MTNVDLSVPARLFSDPARARLLVALADGRALPASRLAAEAGVAASTASGHLARLLEAGAVQVRTQGRHRYYRIADPQVVRVIEDLAGMAPAVPVRSMREGTRAHALRRARLCYDHLAGRLGVSLMAGLIAAGALEGGDGLHHPETAASDRLSAPGHDVDYRLSDLGAAMFADWGVDVAELRAGRRPLVRYCVDWTEQRHHLAGGLAPRSPHCCSSAAGCAGCPCPARCCSPIAAVPSSPDSSPKTRTSRYSLPHHDRAHEVTDRLIRTARTVLRWSACWSV